MSFKERCDIYKKAAKLAESPQYWWKLMSAFMIGQGKTCGQAKGDSIAEVIGTLKFHPAGLPTNEGNVLAISPFNLTVLGAHIAFTPTLLGNVILWKPSPMAVLSNYLLYQIMEEAGMPTGVIQFLPVEDPTRVVEPAIASPQFAGLHYTGSSAVLRALCTQIGTNTNIYKNYPRIVGESGGKNFHLIHNSCKDDIEWLTSAAVRWAYEFQGQKCSALSRLIVPKTMWERGDLKKALVREAS
ncbi:hypothetical protein AFGD_010394 [Aspergillus flavus]|nr:hypothetical protein AFGD_010394 [Aspergillus flavus]